jgi:hypothetical protein
MRDPLHGHGRGGVRKTSVDSKRMGMRVQSARLVWVAKL